jgi:hypothetical protein
MQVLALGLACVAAATEKAGHGVKTLDLQTCQKTRQEAIGKEVTDFNPDVIGIPTLNVDDQNMAQHRFSFGETVEESLTFAPSLDLGRR